MGDGLVRQSVAAKSPCKFSFHALADPKTVNAFSLPGALVLRSARHDVRHGSPRQSVGWLPTAGIFSTHPAPENRAERIKQAIAKQYPNGIPENLKK